jgi:hypothetical protein
MSTSKMGKKKSATKSATLSPAPQPPDFEAKATTSLDNGQAQMKEDVAMHTLCVQQHQPELYEAIMAQGWEQAYLVLKEGISRALKNGKTAILEEGYEKGLKEGEE